VEGLDLGRYDNFKHGYAFIRGRFDRFDGGHYRIFSGALNNVDWFEPISNKER
jgi:hypothetical protein